MSLFESSAVCSEDSLRLREEWMKPVKLGSGAFVSTSVFLLKKKKTEMFLKGTVGIK